MQSKKKDQNGFTILEMMIATGVFSVVLLLCATAIVQVGRLFYKGVIIDRTQLAARTAIDDVSGSIQFGAESLNFFRSGSQTFSGVTVRSYCLGQVRYSYAPGDYARGATASGRIPHILWKDKYTLSGCPPVDLTSSSISGGQELAGDAMRLSRFVVTAPPLATGVYAIELTMSYGATTDLYVAASGYTQCIGDRIGGQFCAVSSITTNAVKRL